MNSSAGPQASTRHAKDRRASYTTKAAQAVATLEQRLAALEGRNHSPNQQNPSKCAAALSIESTFNYYGTFYNTLEARITQLESVSDPMPKQLEVMKGRLAHLDDRLAEIGDRLKPYEDYKIEAINAVKQLKAVHTKLQAGPARPPALVNEHEASIREFSTRLLALEDDHEIGKAQNMSTRDLAIALTQRLRRGELVEQGILRDLQEAIGATTLHSSIQHSYPEVPQVPRQQPTPVSQDDADGTPLAPAVQETSSPRKRKRTIAQSDPVPARRQNDPSEPIGTPDVEDALSSFKSGVFSTRSTQQASDEAIGSAEAVVVPPEVRRTKRVSKGTQQYPNMVPWKEANAQVKAMRPSSASPRKKGQT